VGTIDEWFGRRVEVFRLPTPVLDTMRVRLTMVERSLEEPEDEKEVLEWIRGVASSDGARWPDITVV
jgi:hypothetical protein